MSVRTSPLTDADRAVLTAQGLTDPFLVESIPFSLAALTRRVRADYPTARLRKFKSERCICRRKHPFWSIEAGGVTLCDAGELHPTAIAAWRCAWAYVSRRAVRLSS